MQNNTVCYQRVTVYCRLFHATHMQHVVHQMFEHSVGSLRGRRTSAGTGAREGLGRARLRSRAVHGSPLRRPGLPQFSRAARAFNWSLVKCILIDMNHRSSNGLGGGPRMIADERCRSCWFDPRRSLPSLRNCTGMLAYQCALISSSVASEVIASALKWGGVEGRFEVGRVLVPGGSFEAVPCFVTAYRPGTLMP